MAKSISVLHLNYGQCKKAIINVLVAAEEMKGINDNIFYPLPHDKLQEVLRKYNRLGVPKK